MIQDALVDSRDEVATTAGNNSNDGDYGENKIISFLSSSFFGVMGFNDARAILSMQLLKTPHIHVESMDFSTRIWRMYSVWNYVIKSGKSKEVLLAYAKVSNFLLLYLFLSKPFIPSRSLFVYI